MGNGIAGAKALPLTAGIRLPRQREKSVHQLFSDLDPALDRFIRPSARGAEHGYTLAAEPSHVGKRNADAVPPTPFSGSTHDPASGAASSGAVPSKPTFQATWPAARYPSASESAVRPNAATPTRNGVNGSSRLVSSVDGDSASELEAAPEGSSPVPAWQWRSNTPLSNPHSRSQSQASDSIAPTPRRWGYGKDVYTEGNGDTRRAKPPVNGSSTCALSNCSLEQGVTEVRNCLKRSGMSLTRALSVDCPASPAVSSV